MNIATDVAILNHDIMAVMINNIEEFQKCNIRPGGRSATMLFIGGRSIILYDVIIGAGSVVTRDIPSDSVAVGCPAKVVGRFEDSVRHYMVG